MDTQTATPIDCACVIHGDTYSWDYVEKLYSMLSRNLSSPVRFHVFTESSRPVPSHMIKHVLEEWGIGGPRRGWWYKIQLFNSCYYSGPLLYFDLDTVIVDNIDWIANLPTAYFWGVQDFKYLWRQNHRSLNSSIMRWNTREYDYVWQKFKSADINQMTRRYRGDQDFIYDTINHTDLRYIDPTKIHSWRWQCFGGGYDFAKKTQKTSTNAGILDSNVSVLIFHGKPKPHETADSLVQQHWR